MEIRELIDACINRSKKAWEILVKKYAPIIKRIIERKYKNFPSEEIEDLLQEVFKRLIDNNFKILRKFKGDNEKIFIAYMKKITHSTCCNYIKKATNGLCMITM